MPKVLSLGWETILEIEHALKDKYCQPEDIHEELAVYINTSSWDRPTVFYNDDNDEDCTIAITPILSTEEPDNSLKLISLEVMEIVIPEVGGIDEDILLTIKDDILREKLLNINLLIAKIKALKDNPTPSSDFMTKSC
nr:hypothetical protein [Tanacetum cinerariifolium]